MKLETFFEKFEQIARRLMALVDRLETQLAASRAAVAKLMEAVVAELTAPSQAVGDVTL